MNERRIIELFLALIFTVLLLIAVLLVLNFPQDRKRIGSDTISNSYNAIQNIYVQNPEPIYYVSDYKKIYLKENTFLDYSSYGKYKKTKDFVGSYINEFNVYVKNQDYKGGYFKVRFYFEDYNGKEGVRH